MTLSLTKYHGTGNDFLVLLDLDGGHPVSAALARALCDRHRGVGADGVIRATRPGAGAEGGLLRFELRNADGGEAEMSGNGMRCLAHAAFDAGLVPAGEALTVLTPAGPKVVVLRPGESPGLAWASVEMGVARADGDDDHQLRVDMGNPHLVILVPDPATVAVAELGPAIEAKQPGGINVEWVSLGPGPGEITMRVWERGVGETLACGTGACAAAFAVHHFGQVGAKVTVHQAGGDVQVDLRGDGTVALAGPSQRVAQVEVHVEDLPA
jgi:diaminopimelate epimerase